MSTNDWKQDFIKSNKSTIPGSSQGDWGKILKWFENADNMANNPMLLMNIPENTKPHLDYIIKGLLENSDPSVNFLNIINDIAKTCSYIEMGSDLVIFDILKTANNIFANKTKSNPNVQKKYIRFSYSFLPLLTIQPKDKVEETQIIAGCASTTNNGKLINNSLVPDFTDHLKPELLDLLFVNDYLGVLPKDELTYNPVDFIQKLVDRQILDQEKFTKLNELDVLKESKKNDAEVDYQYGLLLSQLWVNMILGIIEHLQVLKITIDDENKEINYISLVKKINSLGDFIVLLIENRIYSKMNRKGLEIPKDFFYNFKKYLDEKVSRNSPEIKDSAKCDEYLKLLYYFYSKLAKIIERSSIIEITKTECFYDLFDLIVLDDETTVYIDETMQYPLRTIHFRTDFIIEPIKGISIEGFNIPKNFWIDIDKNICFRDKKNLSLFLGIVNDATRLEPLYNVLMWELGKQFIEGGYDTTNTLKILGEKVKALSENYCTTLITSKSPTLIRYGPETSELEEQESLILLEEYSCSAISLIHSDDLNNATAIELLEIMYSICNEGPSDDIKESLVGSSLYIFKTVGILLKNLFDICRYSDADLGSYGDPINAPDFAAATGAVDRFSKKKYSQLLTFFIDEKNKDSIQINDVYLFSICLLEFILKTVPANKKFNLTNFSEDFKTNIIKTDQTIGLGLWKIYIEQRKTGIIIEPLKPIEEILTYKFDLEDANPPKYNESDLWANWTLRNKYELHLRKFQPKTLPLTNASCNVFYLKWCMKNRKELFKRPFDLLPTKPKILGSGVNGWEGWGLLAGQYYSNSGAVELPDSATHIWPTEYVELRKDGNTLSKLIKTVEEFAFKIITTDKEIMSPIKDKVKTNVGRILAGLARAYTISLEVEAGGKTIFFLLSILKWIKRELCELITTLEHEAISNPTFQNTVGLNEFFDNLLGINSMISFVIFRHLPKDKKLDDICNFASFDAKELKVINKAAEALVDGFWTGLGKAIVAAIGAAAAAVGRLFIGPTVAVKAPDEFKDMDSPRPGPTGAAAAAPVVGPTGAAAAAGPTGPAAAAPR